MGSLQGEQQKNPHRIIKLRPLSWIVVLWYPHPNSQHTERWCLSYNTPKSLLSFLSTHSLASEAAMWLCLTILLSCLFRVSVEKHPSRNISSRSCMSLSTGGKRCFQEACLDHSAQLSRICKAAWVGNWRTAKSNTEWASASTTAHISVIHFAKSSPKERGVLAVVLVTRAQHHTVCKQVTSTCSDWPPYQLTPLHAHLD